MLQNAWDFLKDESNRNIIGWIGGGLVVSIGALWALYKHFFQVRHPSSSGQHQPISINIQSIPPEFIQQLIENLDKSQAKAVELGNKLGVHEAAVLSMLRTLDEKKVPLEQLPHQLSEIATRHLELERRLRELTSDDPEVARLRAEAAQALEQGRYDAVDALLDQALKIDANALEQQQQVLDQRKRSAAETLGLRGELAQTRLQYMAAADYFARAAALLPKESPQKRWEYRNRQANALYLQGDEFGDNQALEKSVNVYTDILGSCSRQDEPQDWAMTQNNLGNALQTLGERESGTTHLKQAVDAYRNALKERTRERAPLQWAMTQNNLGNALVIIGERTGSIDGLNLGETTANLREVIIICKDAPYYQKIAQQTLARIEKLLSNKEHSP